MATRIIRDGILTSERINTLSPHAELFYRRLMSVTDDYGRYSANLMQLRAYCYPLKLDSVKEDSISKHLAECVVAKLIVLYTVEAKSYLQMVDFGQRINGKSKYPAPGAGVPGDSPEFPGVSRLVVDVVVDVEKPIGRQADRFSDFWAAYPKRVKRKPTEAKWKAKSLDARADEIIADVRNRLRADRRWLDGFIPDPTTYLTQERWDDELQGSITAPSAKPAGPSETPLERAVAYARQQHGYGAIDLTERDRLIGVATEKHREAQ